MKEERHYIECIDMDYPQRRETKKIQKTLKTLLEQKEHCPNCGGLVPEITFVMDMKEFQFVCYEIAERESWTWDTKETTHKPRKVLAQTDYNQFAEYCKRWKLAKQKE